MLGQAAQHYFINPMNKPGVVVHAGNSSTQEHEAKAIPGYTLSLSPAKATHKQNTHTKQTKEKTDSFFSRALLRR